MTRHSDFQRELARRAREQERQAREAERQRKLREKEHAARLKDAERRRIQAKADQAAEDTAELVHLVEALEALLVSGLRWRPRVNFKSLITVLKIAPFDPGALGRPAAEVVREALDAPRSLNRLHRSG